MSDGPRLLVTGSRDWNHLGVMIGALVQAWRDLGKPSHPVLVHGAARGADSMAAQLWRLWGWPTDPHPADWDRHGRKAGPIRNQEMVDAGADLCVAFPLRGSVGTWDCVRRARAAGIPVTIPESLTSFKEETETA
jgi:hypothetical protein